MPKVRISPIKQQMSQLIPPQQLHDTAVQRILNISIRRQRLKEGSSLVKVTRMESSEITEMESENDTSDKDEANGGETDY